MPFVEDCDGEMQVDASRITYPRRTVAGGVLTDEWFAIVTLLERDADSAAIAA